MNYTQAQIDRANAVSLEDFLRTQGETLIKSGREYRWKEHDSLTVRGNKWFRHSQSKGGYPIDFVMEFYGKSFPEAVQLLTGESGEGQTEATTAPPTAFHLPLHNRTADRAIQYLCESRGLNPKLVEAFLLSGDIYEDAKRHNVVFVGRDRSGTPRYAHVRGTADPFRQDIAGSDKSYPFHYEGNGNQLFVFEAPIDLLSFRVLLGSTAKMGAGTNVQDRLVALHDLDCPWRPGDLAQRKGRIERQGNQNPLVHVYRYVTEGTFDAYLWQTVENKQKFICQIMTSKSPVRSCDDVDETALSFAEIKALCAGDPRIKERMDLDVEVSRLKLMKADHQSKQYRLEDQLLKYFPEEIEKHKGFIKGFESDLEVLAAHPHPEDGFAGMEIRGDLLTDKENAGAALLDACKEVKTSDPVQIGSYRGYAISVEFSAWKQEYTLLLKGQMTHRATLGTDPRGNLTRIDNALAQMPQRLEAAKAQLDNLYQQQAAAKEEVGKPFLYEEELRSKNARLVELDTLLNIDGKGQAHTESVVAKSTRPSVLDNLKRPVQPRSTDKKPKQHEEVR